MVYAVAYSDKNGKDFCDKYPWLLDISLLNMK